jgi:hypothetical protein
MNNYDSTLPVRLAFTCSLVILVAAFLLGSRYLYIKRLEASYRHREAMAARMDAHIWRQQDRMDALQREGWARHQQAMAFHQQQVRDGQRWAEESRQHTFEQIERSRAQMWQQAPLPSMPTMPMRPRPWNW